MLNAVEFDGLKVLKLDKQHPNTFLRFEWLQCEQRAFVDEYSKMGLI